VCRLPLPDNFVDEFRFTEDLIEHHLDVMAGVPVAVVIETASLFQYPRNFDAARTHELDVCLRGFVPVFKGPLLLRLAPEDFIGAVGVERRVNINQIDASVGQLPELIEIVPAKDRSCIEQGGRLAGQGTHGANYLMRSCE